MTLIIAGSRTITSMDSLQWALLKASRQGLKLGEIDEVVSGCASGVDTLGIRWASDRGIPVKRFPAQWNVHGKVAGFIRNGEMAAYADSALIVWDGLSRGTAHMLQEARDYGLRVWVVKISPTEVSRPVRPLPKGL